MSEWRTPIRLFYVRFMDDILVMAPTRWKLRRAVAAVNQILGALRLEKHPDKTFTGKIARGFDFLGYRFGPHGLAIAEATLASFIERATRLFEQERKKPSGFSRLGRYVRRWLRGLMEDWHARWHLTGRGKILWIVERHRVCRVAIRLLTVSFGIVFRRTAFGPIMVGVGPREILCSPCQITGNFPLPTSCRTQAALRGRFVNAGRPRWMHYGSGAPGLVGIRSLSYLTPKAILIKLL